jgi:murein DD-endopeptidase MepM/ murein hydrolase activator NlpD
MKMYSKNIKKIMAASSATILMWTSINCISADSLSDAKQKKQNIQNQITTNNKKISSTESEATEYLKQVDELNKKISEYTNNLSNLEDKVDAVNKKIGEYENDLQNSSQRYSSAEDLYAVRLRSIYENGMPNVIDILFESKGITDFFSKLNVYQSVVEYDKSMVNNIDGEKEYIDNVKSDIEVQKVQLDQLKYDVEKATKTLNDAKSQKQAKVDELNKSKEKLQAVNTVLNKEAEDLNNQIAAEIAAREKKKSESKSSSDGSSSIVASNGKFDWPLKGYGKNRITATFPKYPDGTRHDGIDIGVPVGTPVYAAAAGEVVVSKYYLTGNYDGSYRDGYGNYVMIDHGDYYTLYGHLQYKKVVSAGQSVSKGQLIAYTASTGNSTGPHLHFEVRKSSSYGSAVNPMQFFN